MLKNKQYSGAYYLAGYSIELALKACYCKAVKSKSFPPKKEVYYKLYSHDLNNLLSVSGIERKLQNEIVQTANWGAIKDWSEESRYAIIAPNSARSIIRAVNNEEDGILNLIKELW